MGIITEYTSKNEELTNKTIRQELESKLENIEVSDDLTGTYKNYDYEIDEEYNVYITGKENKEMQLKVNSTAGTTYITINVEASSTNGNIEQYEYTIDGTKYTSTEPVYKIENLSPESNHTIKILVVDENGNTKETRPIKIKTEPRTYLYKEGNECIELTDGWIAYYSDGNNPEAGKVTKENDNIFIETFGTWCAYETQPKEKIDFSNYSKIGIELYDITVVNTGYQLLNVIVGLDINSAEAYTASNFNSAEEYLEIDITNIEGYRKLYIGAGNGASARIKNVWLEK